MVLLKRAILLLTVLATAACGTTSNLPLGTNIAENDLQSVVVMGVNPRTRVQAFRGRMDGQGWRLDKLANASLNTTPEGGYIVAQVEPNSSGEIYGVNRILPTGAGVLSVCTGGMTAVFEIPPRSVVYVGDLNIANNGGYRIQVGYDFEKAAAFMRTNYPAMASRLMKGNLRAAKVLNGECGSGSFMVIVI